MVTHRALILTLSLAGFMLVATAAGGWPQETLSAKPDAAGTIHVSRGDTELAVIELSAHGPGWQHAPQATATAEASPLPGQTGQRFVGTLPIPNTEGGAIHYTETVTPLPKGLRIEYEVTMAGPAKLNGLQVSVYLPVAVFGGREVMITSPQADPQVTGLPEEQQTGQIWGGSGAKIEAAADTDDAVMMELRAATDVLIQDLRQWEHPVYEIRFPAIMADQGRDMSPDDRFHLDLTVTFAAPVRLEPASAAGAP
ncbi:MAG: hypothetical protein J7M38_14220 [Armatimonadetes bacterium]|nr:hypothetical protein [Armatimonadota bacterium]